MKVTARRFSLACTRSAVAIALVSASTPPTVGAATTSLPKAIFARPTCPTADRSPPSLAYQTAAARCVSDVCGPVPAAPPVDFRPDRRLGERYRRLVLRYLSSDRTLAKDAERLRSARPLDRLPVPMIFDAPASWWQNFEAATGSLDTLPNRASPVAALTADVRARSADYPSVIGVSDRALTRALANRLTVQPGPTAGQARAFVERGLAELEARARVDRSPDLARALVIFAVEVSITTSPYGDHLADEHTIVLTPTTLATDYALAVGVHEAGHAVSRFAESSPSVARAVARIKAHLLAIDPSHVTAHVEEDWADYFSARLTDRNLACGWADPTLARERFDYLDVGAGDTHSPLFYRLLAIENAAGRELPLICRDALDARAAEVCVGRNSAASDVSRH